MTPKEANAAARAWAEADPAGAVRQARLARRAGGG